MPQSESIGELAKALSKAQQVMRPAIKDTLGQVGSAKKKYADLSSVWDACREALTGNELSVVQHAEPDEKGSMLLTTVLLHSSGEWISGTMRLPLVNVDPQGYGSACSYARRYSLAAMVGIVSEEDDDGASASPRSNDRQQRAQPPPQAAQQRAAPVANGAPAQERSGSWIAARDAFKQAYAAANHPADRASVMALCQELSGDKEPKRELAEFTEQQLIAMTMQLAGKPDPFAEKPPAQTAIPVPEAFK